MTTQVDAAAERHRWIADRLDAVGRVEVGDLAHRLEVAPETIRRDLRVLEQQGLLQRVHGGAVRRTERPLSPFDGADPEHSDSHRRVADLVMARLASVILPQGARTIFLGTSPMTAAVADALVRHTPPVSDLTIVTSSLDAAVVLSRVECLSVFNLGGAVDPRDRAQQGGWAISELERLRVDLALLPASGVTVAGGVQAPSAMAAAMTSTAMTVADRVWLLIEADALGRPGFVHAGPIDRVDRIFTAGAPTQESQRNFIEAGIDLDGVS